MGRGQEPRKGLLGAGKGFKGRQGEGTRTHVLCKYKWQSWGWEGLSGHGHKDRKWRECQPKLGLYEKATEKPVTL